MLTLTPTVHGQWNRGTFALKPLPEETDDERSGHCMRVQFYWQPHYDKTMRKVKLSEAPKAVDASFSGAARMSWYKWRIERGRPVDDGEVKIQTGHTFTFKTADPQELPLPSRDLLEMQSILQRITAPRASAEESDDEDGDQDFADVNQVASVEPWLESVAVPDVYAIRSPLAARIIASHCTAYVLKVSVAETIIVFVPVDVVMIEV